MDFAEGFGEISCNSLEMVAIWQAADPSASLRNDKQGVANSKARATARTEADSSASLGNDKQNCGQQQKNRQRPGLEHAMVRV
jgi:hypothetical protein